MCLASVSDLEHNLGEQFECDVPTTATNANQMLSMASISSQAIPTNYLTSSLLGTDSGQEDEAVDDQALSLGKCSDAYSQLHIEHCRFLEDFFDDDDLG